MPHITRRLCCSSLPTPPQLVRPQQRDSATVEADVAERGKARESPVDVLAAGPHQAGERRLRQSEGTRVPGQAGQLPGTRPGMAGTRKATKGQRFVAIV